MAQAAQDARVARTTDGPKPQAHSLPTTWWTIGEKVAGGGEGSGARGGFRKSG